MQDPIKSPPSALQRQTQAIQSSVDATNDLRAPVGNIGQVQDVPPPATPTPVQPTGQPQSLQMYQPIQQALTNGPYGDALFGNAANAALGNAIKLGFKEGGRVAKRKLDGKPIGGTFNSKVGLVKNPQGTAFRCGTCKFFKKGVCKNVNPELKGRPVAAHWCCNLYDHAGMKLVV